MPDGGQYLMLSHNYWLETTTASLAELKPVAAVSDLSGQRFGIRRPSS
jgi:hypothetical protein